MLKAVCLGTLRPSVRPFKTACMQPALAATQMPSVLRKALSFSRPKRSAKVGAHEGRTQSHARLGRAASFGRKPSRHSRYGKPPPPPPLGDLSSPQWATLPAATKEKADRQSEYGDPPPPPPLAELSSPLWATLPAATKENHQPQRDQGRVAALERAAAAKQPLKPRDTPPPVPFFSPTPTPSPCVQIAPVVRLRATPHKVNRKRRSSSKDAAAGPSPPAKEPGAAAPEAASAVAEQLAAASSPEVDPAAPPTQPQPQPQPPAPSRSRFAIALARCALCVPAVAKAAPPLCEVTRLELRALQNRMMELKSPVPAKEAHAWCTPSEALCKEWM